MATSECTNGSGISRREFIKTAAAGTAGLALAGLPAGRSEASAKYPHWGEAVVVRDDAATKGPVVNDAAVRGMLEDGIKALTGGAGWKSLIPSYQAGEIVGIKINAQIPRIATQPKVVAAVIHGLVGIGIPVDKIVVWDCEAGSMMHSGMWPLAMEFRGLRIATTDKLENAVDESRTLDIQGNAVQLSRLLTGPAHLINVPVLKNHFEAGITFALKNHVGSAGKDIKDRQKWFHNPIDEKNPIHRMAGRGTPIAERIALINTAPDIRNKTRLIVGDALFGVYTKGPMGEPEFVYNGLILGTDPVAVDHQARVIIEKERKDHNLPFVPSLHIDEAVKLGLGAPIEEIKVARLDRPGKR
ncbi:MAG TPA: DUF362 domain-containing protein [Thermodesulfobacteriota bacterium]|nr:DUF362 domain-containing protein [Thermodesulfobacteriota bacterium]